MINYNGVAFHVFDGVGLAGFHNLNFKSSDLF